MVATNAGGLHVLRHGADAAPGRRLRGRAGDGPSCAPAGHAEGQHRLRPRVAAAPAARGRSASSPRAAAAGAPLPTTRRGGHRLRDAADAVAAAAGCGASCATVLAIELFTDAGLELVMRHAGVPPPFRLADPVYLLVEAAPATTPRGPRRVGRPRSSTASTSPSQSTDPAGRHRLWQLPRASHRGDQPARSAAQARRGGAARRATPRSSTRAPAAVVARGRRRPHLAVRPRRRRQRARQRHGLDARRRARRRRRAGLRARRSAAASAPSTASAWRKSRGWSVIADRGRRGHARHQARLGSERGPQPRRPLRHRFLTPIGTLSA